MKKSGFRVTLTLYTDLKKRVVLMNVYRIAGIPIAVQAKYPFTRQLMRDYLDAGSPVPEFTVSVTDEMLDYEKEAAKEVFPDSYYESTAVLRAVCKEILASYNGFFLHCSCLEMDGKAFIFTAPSGTGKSTHTALWRRYFKDRVTMINDDKPIVRLENGAFYIYGTPWQGKSNIGNNVKVPVHAVCVIKQDKTNHIERLSAAQALPLLMNQTVRPKDKLSMENLLGLLDELLHQIPVYLLGCTISEEAVRTAYHGMR